MDLAPFNNLVISSSVRTYLGSYTIPDLREVSIGAMKKPFPSPNSDNTFFFRIGGEVSEYAVRKSDMSAM